MKSIEVEERDEDYMFDYYQKYRRRRTEEDGALQEIQNCKNWQPEQRQQQQQQQQQGTAVIAAAAADGTETTERDDTSSEEEEDEGEQLKEDELK